MRRTSLLAAGLVLIVAVPAQATAAEQKTRSSAKTTVAALSADQITLSNGKVSTAKLYRDGLGRTRVENGSQVTITDPATQTTIKLDVSKGTFERTTAPKTSPRKATVAQDNASPGPMRSLGTEEINGVRAEVREHTVNLPAMAGLPARTKQVTLWLAAEIQMTVKTRITDGTGYLYEQSYANIRTGVALDAGLFAVPNGFRPAAAAPSSDGIGINADCPLDLWPDPVLLQSYGSFLGQGIVVATTNGAIGCFFAGDQGIFYHPLRGGPLTPLYLTSDQWVVWDNGGLVPYLPYTTFGDIVFLAVNKDDQTVKDSLITLTVWCC
jgi:hypothetical protein